MKYLFLISLLPAICYIVLKSRKSFHMLQQNFYNENNRYLNWISKNLTKVFLDLDLCYVIFAILVAVDMPLLGMGLFFLFYSIVFFRYRQKRKVEQSKKPLVVTARVKRLSITLSLLYLSIFIICFCVFESYYLGVYYFCIGSFIYFNSFFVYFANILNKPVEKLVFYHYKHQANRKLKQMNRMEVIGITGSYGKTSSKNILSDILNVKYNAFPTPKNFNTLYGLINTVNNYLDKFSDFLIAEMGAFHRGDIQQLCDFLHPKYGILTKVGTAHLESFGSQEEIQKGKFELIESLPQEGIGILNGDDLLQKNYPLKNQCKIIWIGIENQDVDVYADKIQLSYQGTHFMCHFKGIEKSYPFETKLLGKANIYNILAGIALGYALGLTIEELQQGVKRVQVIEHRLQLKQLGDLYIIDDAYNSNPVGSAMALEVLSLMPGKKIIVTPGMIELGQEQYETNLEFGKKIAAVADEVILVGEKQTKPILEGLLLASKKEEQIHVLNDVKEAFPLIHKLKDSETYVLLENDLPDIFNE